MVKAASMIRGKRPRLADNAVPVQTLQKVLKSWAYELGCKCIDVNMAVARREWLGKGCPGATSLCWDAPYIFAKLMVEVDATLHPRHSKLVDAIIAENNKGVKFEKMTYDLPLEAMLAARTMNATETTHR